MEQDYYKHLQEAALKLAKEKGYANVSPCTLLNKDRNYDKYIAFRVTPYWKSKLDVIGELSPLILVEDENNLRWATVEENEKLTVKFA